MNYFDIKDIVQENIENVKVEKDVCIYKLKNVFTSCNYV